MKYFIALLLSILLASCTSTVDLSKTSFKDDLNSSVMDFYDNDTTGISNEIYFIR